MAFDLTVLATFQANNKSLICSAVGWISLTHLMSSSVITPRSLSCTNSPPVTRLKSSDGWAVLRSPHSNARTFFLADNTSLASSSTLGAMITSTNCLSIIS